MKIIVKSLLLIAVLVSLHARAQTEGSNRDLVSFSWEMGFPSSNKYLNESSLSGWRFEYRKGIKPYLSIGLGLSWNAFDEYIHTKTYTSSDSAKAITTDMIRQVYTLPITLTAHYYYPTKSKIMQPYLGVGLGGQYAENNTYMNIYSFNENNWGFVIRPEVGALFTFSPRSPVKALLGLGLNVSTNKYEAFDINGWNHVTVNVGIGIGTGDF
jgi:outer membrane protein W